MIQAIATYLMLKFKMFNKVGGIGEIRFNKIPYTRFSFSLIITRICIYINRFGNFTMRTYLIVKNPMRHSLLVGYNRMPVFVDDSPEQIAAVQKACPAVKTVKVPAKTRRRKWLRLLPSFVSRRGCSEAYSDPGVGIDRADAYRILKSVDGAGDVALFDWGRTLAQVKGVNLDGARPGEQEAVLRWAVGGAARLAMLRQMFAELRRRGVTIAMLSNSPSCSKPGWRALIRRLVGGPVLFWCGHGDKGRRLSRKMKRLC